MTSARPRRQVGFTLLEVLVAIAIFAIVGVMSLTGYTQLQKQTEYQEQRLARVREVQRAVQTIAQDLTQIEPRPIREPIGEQRIPAVVAGDSVEYKVEFTRAGWTNTAGLPRPTLQRVAYRLDQDGLWRDYWRVLDRTQTAEPVRYNLLKGVRSVTFRFMTPAREWVDRWPETDARNPAVEQERARPAAVEVTLELEDWGVIRRLVEVAG
ncbi:MAG TPA: type II secretion system minor pseudopilin GspJ [Steroidobacteraceae bacterium]|nr:type II secretion system minor pseudopilin GspJ [Steroidobacteraceae bacterium]